MAATRKSRRANNWHLYKEIPTVTVTSLVSRDASQLRRAIVTIDGAASYLSYLSDLTRSLRCIFEHTMRPRVINLCAPSALTES